MWLGLPTLSVDFVKTSRGRHRVSFLIKAQNWPQWQPIASTSVDPVNYIIYHAGYKIRGWSGRFDWNLSSTPLKVKSIQLFK